MATSTPVRKPPLDIERVRADFPAMGLDVHGHSLVYLDTAASAQKPSAVIEAEARCYREFYANVHRGVHYLSERATAAYEEARARVQRFVGAADPREIVLVRGTTEGVNLVASTFGRTHVGTDDEVLITGMEHHSNIVPWQMLCEEKGARLRVAPIDDRGEVRLEEFEALLSDRTKIAAFVHVSNALGTVNPVGQMVEMAKRRGVTVLIDGAQAAPHLPIDVQELGCDFYLLSGHKMYGPSGIGALYGKLEHLESMPPYQGGGEMIASVTFERTEYAAPPAKFEAGTPNIAGAVGLGATVAYLEELGMDAIGSHEAELLSYGTQQLESLPGVRLIGTARHKAGVLSFTIDGVHAHDIGTILDREGIAVRAGHHCAQPVMERFGVAATARASLGVYNTKGDLDRLVVGIQAVQEMFR